MTLMDFALDKKASYPVRPRGLLHAGLPLVAVVRGGQCKG